MPGIAIACFAGVACLLFGPDELPSPVWAVIAAPVGVLAWRDRRWCLPAAFALGFGWAWFAAAGLLGHWLPAALEGRDIVVEGRIADLPDPGPRGTRLVLAVDRSVDAGSAWPSPGRIRLGWYGHHPEPRAGERWRLVVRLKRPRGLANPGGFDYGRWLFAHRITATGYVRPSGDDRRLGPAAGWGPRWQAGRQGLRDRLETLTEGRPNAGILIALAIGDRHAITAGQWRVLRETGTSHLVAISGLHVGLVALWGFWLVRGLWGCSRRLTAWQPAPVAGAVAGLVVATLYAAMAGFSLPTQRAVVMLAVAVVVIVGRRRIRASDGLALALVVVLSLDPLAVLSAGLYLSFGIVAMILLAMRHRFDEGPHRWFRGLRLHGLLALGSTPLAFAFFQQASIVAPLANLVAIPWVGLGVVPPTLLAILALPLSPALSQSLLVLADRAMDGLWACLEALTALPGGHGLALSPPAWTLVLAGAGVLVLLAPRGWPGRWTGLVAFLPALLVRPPTPDTGAFELVLLDVGQGLAAVVRTARHTLVYDTGPRYGPGFDAGSGIIVPFLHDRGIDHIDTLVVGHGDADHIGGVDGLRDGVRVDRVLSSVPGRLPWRTARPCRTGQAWRWDGVPFRILHPDADGRHGNDASCVLKVGQGRRAVLLTGDIESWAERRLLGRAARRIGASVLVVPHHGSATSSTPAFIDAVDPRYALFPTGYGNRFRLPRRAVVERYRRRGIAVLDTAVDGAIVVRIEADGRIDGPVSWRASEARLWRRRQRFRGRPAIQYDGASEAPLLR